MTWCTDCKAASETSGLWAQHNPACLHCGARLIQRLGKLRTPTSEQITARRKAVLADWIAHGHSELQIRALVKGPLAVAESKGARK